MSGTASDFAWNKFIQNFKTENVTWYCFFSNFYFNSFNVIFVTFICWVCLASATALWILYDKAIYFQAFLSLTFLEKLEEFCILFRRSNKIIMSKSQIYIMMTNVSHYKLPVQNYTIGQFLKIHIACFFRTSSVWFSSIVVVAWMIIWSKGKNASWKWTKYSNTVKIVFYC